MASVATWSMALSSLQTTPTTCRVALPRVAMLKNGATLTGHRLPRRASEVSWHTAASQELVRRKFCRRAMLGVLKNSLVKETLKRPYQVVHWIRVSRIILIRLLSYLCRLCIYPYHIAYRLRQLTHPLNLGETSDPIHPSNPSNPTQTTNPIHYLSSGEIKIVIHSSNPIGRSHPIEIFYPMVTSLTLRPLECPEGNCSTTITSRVTKTVTESSWGPKTCLHGICRTTETTFTTTTLEHNGGAHSTQTSDGITRSTARIAPTIMRTTKFQTTRSRNNEPRFKLRSHTTFGNREVFNNLYIQVPENSKSLLIRMIDKIQFSRTRTNGSLYKVLITSYPFLTRNKTSAASFYYDLSSTSIDMCCSNSSTSGLVLFQDSDMDELAPVFLSNSVGTSRMFFYGGQLRWGNDRFGSWVVCKEPIPGNTTKEPQFRFQLMWWDVVTNMGINADWCVKVRLLPEKSERDTC